MNVGKLRERAFVLRLKGESDLRWEPERPIWVQVTETGKRCLFSQFGVGKSGADFLMREGDITMNDAILWRGQHYFISDIQRTGLHPRYLTVSCARVTPEIAEHSRPVSTRGALGRPETERQRLGSCPVCLTEKYLRDNAEDSHLEQQKRLVAVAPKALRCEEGDILTILGGDFRVMVCHRLEAYKNEYEIERVTDD